MSNYDIAISGFDAAQKALDTIGNNIANAATEGYHRQRINLSPAYSSQEGSVLFGGGVNVESVTRMIDNLLEQEILRQQSLLEQVSQEFVTLRTVENAFGEFSTEDSGLNAAIDKFFNALQDLSAHPAESIWQNQAISDAEAMAGQFRTLGEFLTTLETQIGLEAQNTIESINTLTSQIAELNSSIGRIEIGGGQANNLRDQRDQYITELSKLIGVQTLSRDYGVVDVSVAGIPVVMDTSTVELEVGLDENDNLGISIAGASTRKTDIQGGKIGGLLSLKNVLISGVQTKLNSLASAIIQQINQYHVQGVGSEGSFSSLTGWAMVDEDLDDFTNPSVTDGKIYIRVTYTNPTTSVKTITRHEIPVDKSADSLSDIKTRISAITGLSASVVSSRLSIKADANYEFDFLPGVLPTWTTSGLTGGSVPDISISADMQTYLNTDDGASNEIQTITSADTPTVGSYTLSFGGETTDSILYTADAATIKSALVDDISTIDTDDIDVTGGPIGAANPIVIKFKGDLAAQDVGDITIDKGTLESGGSPIADPIVTESRQGHAASGLFTGSANRTYTCTVVGTGDVGVASNLKIEVKIDLAGTAVKTVIVGSGYAAGDRLDIGDGIFISIGTGTLNDGEVFTIEALANSDTSGLLAAVGINTFFSGSSAEDIAVCSGISTTPGQIATALGADMTDNANASRMVGLRDQDVSTLSDMEPGEFYRRLVTDIGQQLYVKQMSQDNIEVMVQNLANQQSEISGVDINDEAAQLLIFEQMFRAMAKYMNTIQLTIAAIMEVI